LAQKNFRIAIRKFYPAQQASPSCPFIFVALNSRNKVPPKVLGLDHLWTVAVKCTGLPYMSV